VIALPEDIFEAHIVTIINEGQELTIGIQKSFVHVLQEYLEDKTYLDNYTNGM